jgi:uncharacterized glyoxalase superfamily protein PhnB
MLNVPIGWSAVTPRIVVYDAAGLVEFINYVFGAVGDYRPEVPSVVQIAGSKIMVSDAGVRRPSPAFLHVYVEDVSRPYGRALERGARSVEAPGATPYGDLRCMIEDGWGNAWQIAAHGAATQS